jgi:hypothetical protein
VIAPSGNGGHAALGRDGDAQQAEDVTAPADDRATGLHRQRRGPCARGLRRFRGHESRLSPQREAGEQGEGEKSDGDSSFHGLDPFSCCVQDSLVSWLVG